MKPQPFSIYCEKFALSSQRVFQQQNRKSVCASMAQIGSKKNGAIHF
jgi:hypothetical protein